MNYPVRGYIKPEAAFLTIPEWKAVAKQFIALQKKGIDTRGGVIDDDPTLVGLINKYFAYQLYVETERYSLLTKKNVLDFIEDFVNHKVWGLEKEYKSYFTDDSGASYINTLRFAYFYSRGDMEPFVLLDEVFTKNAYGTTTKQVTALHWTSIQGMKNIVDSIQTKYHYAISTFTKQWKKFFRTESNVLVKLQGDLVAAFKSDVKSVATDRGNRAANLYRMAYPGGSNNLVKDMSETNEDGTYLWNEIIMKPKKVIDYKIVNKY